MVNRLRRRTWEIVEIAEPGDRPSRIFDVAIRVLIALNVLAVVVETVPEIQGVAGSWLYAFDLVSVGVFTVEYIARVWSCTEDPRYARPLVGRLRFAVTPLALVDLLAILPFWLPVLGVDLRILRGVRLFRLFRILKIARYSRALRTFGRVFRSKAEELVLTFALVGFLLLMASSLLYFA
ncbi:MAG: ion transporter, partial [Longimicrobiales bacterium]|nr:ion transporter [Longimicrobiales bacterium]